MAWRAGGVRTALPLVTAVLIALLAGCEQMRPRVDVPQREQVRAVPPPLDSLRAAPETIRAGSLRLAAGAELWLNLMPGVTLGEGGSGPSGSPLRGRIGVHPVDTLEARPLPVGLGLSGAWLRAGDSVWSIPVAPAYTARAGATRLAHEVGGGPAWLRGGGRVDVVLRVRVPDGASRLVQARGVQVSTVE